MSAVMNRPYFADAAAFLAWEEAQPERYEFVGGEVYAMTGARVQHNVIAGNAFVFLRGALRGAPCRVHMADVKLNIDAEGAYVYPDIMVTCDAADRAAEQSISHPWLIIEVLSDSTAAYDRGRKFELYRQIDSLTHYLLIEQTRAHADLFVRNDSGQWVLQPLTAADTMRIDRLGAPWPVASLFDDVEFNVAAPAMPAGAA